MYACTYEVGASLRVDVAVRMGIAGDSLATRALEALSSSELMELLAENVATVQAKSESFK